MKLRFRNNTLRLRVNQQEVNSLASGAALEESVVFPNNSQFVYRFEPVLGTQPQASFEAGRLEVIAPLRDIEAWASGDSVGLYFNLPAQASTLRVAIEKDLECVDGPPEERDPHAFPRAGKQC